MDQSIETMSTIPTRMYEAWNRGDVAGFFADFAEDVVSAELEGTIYRSRAEAVTAHEELHGTVMKGSQRAPGLPADHGRPGVLRRRLAQNQRRRSSVAG
ncbi:hypothetical protein [Actinoplanes sp. M2I2]|uniref:hypothetical protein n=1 Tax=Actinoplanes sp. M2I2 TaxID=1734444 RepID=UPI0020200A6B|nr:hypothetical protein [Actinoplanes sp. M2I2]